MRHLSFIGWSVFYASDSFFVSLLLSLTEEIVLSSRPSQLGCVGKETTGARQARALKSVKCSRRGQRVAVAQSVTLEPRGRGPLGRAWLAPWPDSLSWTDTWAVLCCMSGATLTGADFI